MVCCSLRAFLKINSKDNQQNALTSLTNVCVTLHHRKFLHVSIYKNNHRQGGLLRRYWYCLHFAASYLYTVQSTLTVCTEVHPVLCNIVGVPLMTIIL